MPAPEREIAVAMARALSDARLIDARDTGIVADLLRAHLDRYRGRRGLKDDEIGRLINAIRDNVKPITASQQLRARIAAATLTALRAMSLCWDASSDDPGSPDTAA